MQQVSFDFSHPEAPQDNHRTEIRRQEKDQLVKEIHRLYKRRLTRLKQRHEIDAMKNELWPAIENENWRKVIVHIYGVKSSALQKIREIAIKLANPPYSRL